MFADAVQQALHDLDMCLVAHDANQNDRVTMLIGECLYPGSMPGSEVLARIAQLGFRQNHIGIRLDKDMGRRWHRSDDGLYHLKR